MKLVLFNGSPRYKKSNSALLADHFLKGYAKVHPETVEVHYLANLKKRREQVDAFANAELVIMIFPLYTDCMPAIVKEFFEQLILQKGNPEKQIGFIVQSGFPEAMHSVWLERYLDKLIGRMGYRYLGTVIRGGVEGIQIMPWWMTRKLYRQFEELGEQFARYGRFDSRISTQLGHPYKMSAIGRIGFSIFNKLGLTNFYWNSNLKKNGAWEKRFDRPYK